MYWRILAIITLTLTAFYCSCLINPEYFCCPPFIRVNLNDPPLFPLPKPCPPQKKPILWQPRQLTDWFLNVVSTSWRRRLSQCVIVVTVHRHLLNSWYGIWFILYRLRSWTEISQMSGKDGHSYLFFFIITLELVRYLFPFIFTYPETNMRPCTMRLSRPEHERFLSNIEIGSFMMGWVRIKNDGSKYWKL